MPKDKKAEEPKEAPQEVTGEVKEEKKESPEEVTARQKECADKVNKILEEHNCEVAVSMLVSPNGNKPLVEVRTKV